jgi:hypothetical protein
MKRLQISIEPELDLALERKARQEGRSKAALIRQYVRERLGGLPPLKSDPLWRMAGADGFDPAPIDETVYR